MYPETVNKQTGVVLEKIAKTTFVRQFYLAGGTALALELGYRMSVDLDFFTDSTFSTSTLKNELVDLGKLTVTDEDPAGTLNAILDEVEISFFIYKYKTVYPMREYGGVYLADERDIGAMKLDAISSRGSKKDFIDLYVLLQKYSLSELIGFFETRFCDVEYNKIHILKSLSYFADAEDDPSPIMLKNISWETVKDRISQEAKRYIG